MTFGGGPGDSSGRVAIYARLSVNENGERDESLETQCQLLQSFVEQCELGAFGFYVDSDISGTCFDRPGLIQLVKDINEGNVNTVLVKDLSRLGRNNGETLTFLDFLREKDIRLIALGDNYDSFRDDDDTIGIRTWVNEHYARDISKKVRYNLKKKMQNGQFLGRPPFGYLKSGQQKNKLVVDERYKDIIGEIFDLYISGWGYRALAEYVQSMDIPTPSQDKGYAGAAQASRWNEQHIRRIIKSRVYCGDTVQGVSEKVSFKSKKTRRLDSERWIVVPDTHQPVISRETFTLAQHIREKRCREGQGRKRKDHAGPHLFTGFVVCAACGSNHTYRKKRSGAAGYICGQYNRFGRKGCSSHYISEKTLADYIIKDIKTMAKGISFQQQLIEKYRQESSVLKNKDANIERIENEVARRNRQLQIAYMDRVRGIISEQIYLAAVDAIKREIGLLTHRIQKQNDQVPAASKDTDVNELLNTLSAELLNAEDVDRVLLENYIKKIIVLEKGDTIHQNIWQRHGLEVLTGKHLHAMEQDDNRLIFIYNLDW